jgi:tetratricopeptide (TPR) repeat protein
MAQEAGDEAGLRQVSRLARTHAGRLGDPEFAKWSLQTRVQLQPQDLAAWQRLAARAEAEGRDAEDVWKQAIEETPDSAPLHRAYARTLFEKGDAEGAFAHLENLPRELAGSAEIGDARVMLHLLAGDTAAARSIVEEMRRSQPEAYQTGIAAARVNLQEGRVDEAAEGLRRLAGQFEQGEIFRLLAIAEARLGRSGAAVTAADRAIELEPNASVVPYKIRMAARESKEDWTGVLRTWRTLRRIGFRVDEQQQTSRINALYGLGRPEIARKILENLLAQDETRTPGIVTLFARHEGHNQPERAMELLDAALEKDPDNWQLVRTLAVRELRMRRPERALARIEAFESTGAGSLPGLKAQVYTALGRLPEAEAAARENFDLTPRGPNAVTLLVGILQEQGKVDEAIALLEDALGKSRRGLALHFELGKLYRLKGDYDQALVHLERAHQLQPEWVPPMNDLAYTLAETSRDLDRAVELARTAKARAPDSDAVADTLGYAYYKKGLYEPASFELRAAIDLAKARGYQSADYQYHLGLVLQAMGREDEARRAFDEALRIDPGHAKATRALQSLASATAERPGA